MQVQNARSAIDTVIAALPAAQRLIDEKSIRPQDDLDKRRIDDWFLASPLKQYRAPTAAAPAAAARNTTVSTRDFVSMYSEDVSTWFFKEGEPRPEFPEPEPAPTARALLGAVSDSEDDAPAAMLTDAAPAAPLMLTDAATDGVVAIAGHPAACAEVWKDGLKSMAVVVACTHRWLSRRADVREVPHRRTPHRVAAAELVWAAKLSWRRACGAESLSRRVASTIRRCPQQEARQGRRFVLSEEISARHSVSPCLGPRWAWAA